MTRILYLVDYQLDYGAEMLLNGLYKILGKDNLIIHPFLRRYSEGIDKDYILPGGNRGYTSLPAQFSPLDLVENDIDEILHGMQSGDFDFIVMASPREYVIKSMEVIREKFGKIPLPVVFCDFEDYSSLRWDIVQRYDPICYFKRELVDTDENRKLCRQYSIYPLPFSAITDNLAEDVPYEEKDIDIFFAAGLTHEIRERIVLLLDELRREESINFVGGIDPPPKGREDLHFRESYENYCKLMGRAKINITARGFGYDTVRRFEVMCYSGLVLADTLPLQTPFPFTDGENIVYYDNDLNNLKALIRYYLENEEERRRIGKAGKEHCFKFHSTFARAKYFLEVVKKCLKSP